MTHTETDACDLEIPLLDSFSRRFHVERQQLERILSEDNNYSVYPRRRGRKVRWIEAPRPWLKRVQRSLLDLTLSAARPSAWCHGFCLGRSIFTNAANHVGRQLVITMDIKDFFPTICSAMIRPVVSPFAANPYELELLMALVTRRDRLPQGAPTSPHLANLVFSPVDAEIVARLPVGWTYSRYADDLAFSGDDDPGLLVQTVTQLLSNHGFWIAPHKTRVMGRNRRQIVTGLVVNDRVQVPRPLRKKWRATLHHIRRFGFAAAKPSDPASLQGFAAYIEAAERFGRFRSGVDTAQGIPEDHGQQVAVI
jgi:hypothetical protein